MFEKRELPTLLRKVYKNTCGFYCFIFIFRSMLKGRKYKFIHIVSLMTVKTIYRYTIEFRMPEAPCVSRKIKVGMHYMRSVYIIDGCILFWTVCVAGREVPSNSHNAHFGNGESFS